MKKTLLKIVMVFAALFLTACASTNFSIESGVKDGTALLDDDNDINIQGTTSSDVKYIAIVSEGRVIDFTQVEDKRFKYSAAAEDLSGEIRLMTSKEEVDVGDDALEIDGKSIKVKVPTPDEDDNLGDNEDDENDLEDDEDNLEDDEDSLEDDEDDYTSTPSKPINVNDYKTGVTYDNIARTPDDYKGKKLTLTGKVVQTLEDEDQVDMRLAVDGDYDKIVYLTYNPDIMGGKRILEDDKITIYGISGGMHTYESTLGADISIPLIYVNKIDSFGPAPDGYGY